MTPSDRLLPAMMLQLMSMTVYQAADTSEGDRQSAVPLSQTLRRLAAGLKLLIRQKLPSNLPPTVHHTAVV